MNHADITSLRCMRNQYSLKFKWNYGSLNNGCWLFNMYYHGDDLPVRGRPHGIGYRVSRWDRIKLVFERPQLYLRYDLNREYVYSTQDIETICYRTITQEKMEKRSAVCHDIALLVYDNENKRWHQLKWAPVEEIDCVLGVTRDMTYTEYWGAILDAFNKYLRCDVSGSKSRARAIAWCIIRSIDDKIAHCQTVVRPFGIAGDGNAITSKTTF